MIKLYMKNISLILSLILSFTYILFSVQVLAVPSGFDNGYIASVKYNRCFKVNQHPELGDVRPSRIYLKWKCRVASDEPSKRTIVIACDGTPLGDDVAFPFAKTFQDCMSLLKGLHESAY